MMSFTMGMRGGGGRSPVRVGNLLTRAVPALAERLLEESIRREWAQTVGSDAARRSRPISLRQGILQVSVDNSPWLHELTLRSAAISTALCERHGATVDGVRFVLATAGPSAAPVTPAHSRTSVPSRQLSAEEARQVDDAARRLADHGLAASFRRLLTKDLLARGERGSSAASERI
jgi:hypothetical protein